MKPRIAKLLASLMIDDWPMPDWLRRRIAAHPDVQPIVDDVRQFEKRLRSDSNVKDCWDRSTRVEPNAQVSRTRLIQVIVATAAVALICAGVWNWNRQEESVGLPAGPMVDAVDIRPVMASLAAGQKVAQKVSSGFRDIGTQLAQAGNRISGQLVTMSPEELEPDARALSPTDPQR